MLLLQFRWIALERECSAYLRKSSFVPLILHNGKAAVWRVMAWSVILAVSTDVLADCEAVLFKLAVITK